MENPNLSIAEYDKDDKLATDKYDTFISIMLYAFDEMINGGQDISEYWTPVIEGQVEVHEKYLAEIFGGGPGIDYGTAYSERLTHIIRRKLAELARERSKLDA